jgi:hypothetical protein
MTINAFLVRSLALVVGVSAMVVSAVTAAALVVNGFIEGVLVASLLGGALVALFLRSTSGHPSSAVVPDPFKRDMFSADIVNVAHIRVAGVGGLCLVIVAAAVTLEFQLITAAMAVGLVGGVVTGVALIAYRRHHPSVRRATL